MPANNPLPKPPVRLELPACPKCGEEDQVEVVVEYVKSTFYYCTSCGCAWSVKRMGVE